MFILATDGFYRSRGGTTPVLQSAPWTPMPFTYVRGGFTPNPDAGLPFVLVTQTSTASSDVYEFSRGSDGGLTWSLVTAAPFGTLNLAVAPDGTLYAGGLFGPASYGVKNSPAPHTSWTSLPTPVKRDPLSSLSELMYLPACVIS